VPERLRVDGWSAMVAALGYSGWVRLANVLDVEGKAASHLPPYIAGCEREEPSNNEE
jgi:hypothetical protein